MNAMAGKIHETHYAHYDALREAGADLLARCFRNGERPAPYLVLLPGGNTPRPIYDRLIKEAPEAGPGLHVALTDERHVSPSDPQSNIGMLTPMLDALGVQENRRLCVHTARHLRESADLYNEQLEQFLAAGGTVELALLGLGADGHTCSLFTPEDLERGSGRWAIPVEREGGVNRVSVTQNLLARARRVVFLAVGIEKHDIVRRLLSEPESVVAGRAVADAERVELWWH